MNSKIISSVGFSSLLKYIINSLRFLAIKIYQKISSFLSKNTFLKNVLTLLTGTVVAQAVPILISPILTRLYSPEEIGAYTIFFATSNILAIFISGRLELAILIPKRKLEGKAILYLSILISTVATVILFIITLVFKNSISNALGLNEIKEGILFIPITAFFLAMFQIFNYWLNRNDSYKTMSVGKITQSLTTSLFHLIGSFLGALGLVLGRLSGSFLSSFYILYSTKTTLKELFSLNKTVLRKTLKKYSIYPLVTMPNAVLNSTSNNLPNYLLETFYSVDITGFYSWSVRIIQGPMSMITSSIQQVFYRKATELFNNGGDLYALTIKMYKRLFLIGLIPYLILFVYAPEIYAFVFGEEWRIAGMYTVYLVPWFFIMFLNSPINCLVLVLNKQKIYFIFEVALFICRAGSLYAGYFYFNEAKYSIIFYGITGFFFNIILFFILIRFSRQFSYERHTK